MFYYQINLVSQCSHLEVLLVSIFGCERRNFSQDEFTFIQIGSGHTVVIGTIELKNLLYI